MRLAIGMTKKGANASNFTHPLFNGRGYTLIEILIVLFIISIVTSIALLTISHNENRQLASFANEIVERVSLAEEQAMLQPSVLGLSFDENSFQFFSLQSVISKREGNKKMKLLKKPH